MTILCLFSPLTTQKIKILKLKKNTWRYHFTHLHHNWKSYDVWFLRYGASWRSFFVILDHFLHFYSPNSWKNQNFEEMKKAPGDTIILHMCNINENHMIYGSWDMGHDRLNFMSSWTIFCLFTPLTTRKTKILKKMNKTSEDIIILHMCTSNNNHTMYGSWDMTCDRQNFLSFWIIFCPFTPSLPNNPKTKN